MNAHADVQDSRPLIAWTSPRRIWKAIMAITLVLLVLAGVWLVRRAQEADVTGTARFRTAAVTQGPLEARITATGTLSALVTVQVGSQVSGRIQALFVDHNSRVHKGQRLAQIDPRLFESAVEQARANQAVARANLTRADAGLYEAARQEARAQALFGRGVSGQQELDAAVASARSARAQLSAAQAQLAQASAARRQAELNLAFTEIVSPIDGVVISRNGDVGQTVAAAFQAPVLFLLAENLEKMQVDTNVAEADVGRLQPNMPARFTVDAYPNEIFTGHVRQVRNAPQTLQNVVTYDAVIDVSNPELKLKPGMTANVSFVYAARDKALLVPNAALRFRPPPDLVERARALTGNGRDSRRVVFVLEAGQARPVAVRTGVTDGALTEVLEGNLASGTPVITDTLANGKSGPGSFGRVF
ncbi:MAG TPA: efflux RND transporter periplasmic adaptor subunit [Polyangia bacterium]